MLEPARGELATLSFIFLLTSIVSTSLEGKGISHTNLSFPELKIYVNNSIDSHIKEATKISWHLGVFLLMVVDSSWLNENVWVLGP